MFKISGIIRDGISGRIKNREWNFYIKCNIIYNRIRIGIGGNISNQIDNGKCNKKRVSYHTGMDEGIWNYKIDRS